MHRKVVAYWHDTEGTLVAGCDDGTVWNWVWDNLALNSGRWRSRNLQTSIPQPRPQDASVSEAYGR